MFDRFIQFFSSFQSGFTPLAVGQSEVEVFTAKTPVEVWFSKYSNGNLAVCQAARPSLDYDITPTGFVIYADVPNDGLILQWFVWFN
jgi:hypothetical protein